MRISDWSPDVCSSDLLLSRFASARINSGLSDTRVTVPSIRASRVSFLSAKGVLNIIINGSVSAPAGKLPSARKADSLAAIFAPEMGVQPMPPKQAADDSTSLRTAQLWCGDGGGEARKIT